MSLSVLKASDALAVSSGSAYPIKSEVAPGIDIQDGHAVQWNIMPYDALKKWQVTFHYTIAADEYDEWSAFGLGFGQRLNEMSNIDIMRCQEIAICDVLDGEINIMGSKSQKKNQFDLQDRANTGRVVENPQEEWLMVEFDSEAGHLCFTISSHLCRGRSHVQTVQIQKPTLKGVTLFPTAVFAGMAQNVRITMAQEDPPPPMCRRLLLTNFSKLLGSDVPHGAVTFHVEGHEIIADRFLLAARSEYFETMLRSGLAETDAKVISIPGASRTAFCAVLQFIYAGGTATSSLFEEGDVDALELFHLSMQYMLDDLTRLCEWKLIQDMTPAKALALFGSITCAKDKAPKLFAACLNTLKENMALVVDMPEFSELCKSEDAMRMLLLHTAGLKHSDKRRKLRE